MDFEEQSSVGLQPILLTALEKSDCPMYLVDQKLSLSAYNPAFASLAGFSPKLGSFLGDLPCFADQSYQEFYSKCLQQGTFFVEHCFAVDGQLYDLRLQQIKLPEHGTMILGIACAVDDSTEHIEARCSAEAVYRAKSEFMANMSHSLRTPLNHIIGYSEMLTDELDEVDKDEIRTDLQRITRSGRQLLGLINHIISLALAEAGKTVTSREVFETVPVVRELLSLVQPEMKKRKNTLYVYLDGAPKEVCTDKEKFRDILYQLILYTNQFPSKGELHLSVKPEAECTLFELRCLDQEMNQDQLSELKKTFQKPEEVPFPKDAGQSLGLVLTAKYCQLIKAELEVQNSENRGTIFSLRLPLTQFTA